MWDTAGRHAADVVRYLEAGRINAARNAEAGYRQCYRRAAGCEGLAVPPGPASCSEYASGLSGDAVCIPRTDALALARAERDSYRIRARAGGPCATTWRAGSRVGAQIADELVAGRDRRALAAMHQMRRAWADVARCEGVLPLSDADAAQGYEAEFSRLEHKIDQLLAFQESEERYRRWATWAAIAGALFAAVRLGIIAVPHAGKAR